MLCVIARVYPEMEFLSLKYRLQTSAIIGEGGGGRDQAFYIVGFQPLMVTDCKVGFGGVCRCMRADTAIMGMTDHFKATLGLYSSTDRLDIQIYTKNLEIIQIYLSP